MTNLNRKKSAAGGHAFCKYSKTILACLLVMAMVLCLVACGSAADMSEEAVSSQPGLDIPDSYAPDDGKITDSVYELTFDGGSSLLIVTGRGDVVTSLIGNAIISKDTFGADDLISGIKTDAQTLEAQPLEDCEIKITDSEASFSMTCTFASLDYTDHGPQAEFAAKFWGFPMDGDMLRLSEVIAALEANGYTVKTS